MFYDPGCTGRVQLGALPSDIQRRLAALPGEWLEYDPASAGIIVRNVQPAAGPSLSTIAGELVRMLAEIPVAHHAAIRGGDLLVHTDGSFQLVRLRVEAGGAVHIRWAHPDYDRAQKRPWQRGTHDLVETKVQRLNGEVTFRAADAAKAAAAIQHAADTYEGLYPEGECAAAAGKDGTVRVTLRDVNLDAEVLVAALQGVARPGTLAGRVEVSSFAAQAPEHDVRFVFQDDGVWIQRPVLWDSET